ncbi:MAG: MBL fold metallo-hydrolase [Bacteroidetes bacterium]|nr:MBL fold metallo-hydrolase [Bacteroidota bacterium]
MLKLSGASVGGLILGNPITGMGSPSLQGNTDPSQRNSLYDALPVFTPGTPLGAHEMRITFLGTSCIPRLSQECNSVFVEVGSGDQFVFDCGTGVIAKYNALGVPMSKLNKIFFTHLHADHTSDLTHIYGFGPSGDRKSPLYIWGPTNSGWTYLDPLKNTRGPYDDGTRAFCENFRNLMRWHTESFSFGSTSYTDNLTPDKIQAAWGLKDLPVKVGDDADIDGYAIFPIELDWNLKGDVDGDNIAYYNDTTKVTIKHFPAIHTRRGSISYKLEWNGLSMIFSGDTKPNTNMVNQGGGVDVLIHEMVMPAYDWALKNSGLPPSDPNFNTALEYATLVQNSSHTPQGAFGFLLSQMKPPPRLAVATHFQAADDTISSAMRSVRNHYPAGEVTFASDLMVITVSANEIRQERAVVSAYAFYPVSPIKDVNDPLYWKWDDPVLMTNKVSDPTVQDDLTTQILPTDPDTQKFNYRADGY